MRTILLRPTIPTPVSLLDPVLEAPLGRGAFAFRPVQKRPLQRFRLRFAGNDQQAMENLRELTFFNGGYTPLWFDGNAWSETREPMLVWIGDGTTKEFILPFSNVFPPTSVFTENGIPKIDWTMPDNGVSGITVFSTAPGNGSEILWKGIRKIKVRVLANRDKVYGSQERAPYLFEETIDLEELP